MMKMHNDSFDDYNNSGYGKFGLNLKYVRLKFYLNLFIARSL